MTIARRTERTAGRIPRSLAGVGAALLVAVALSPAPARAQSIVLDDFNSGPITVTLNSAPGTQANFIDGSAGSVLGTERNLRVSGSSVAGGNISETTGMGSWSFVRPAGSNGTIELWWDGNNNSTSFSTTGLGGANLSLNGQNALRFTVASSSSAALSLAVYFFNDVNVSRGELTLPPGGGTVDLPYSSFSVFGGSGIDFASVGAILIGTTSPSDAAWSAVIDDIRTVQSNLIFADGFATGTFVRWSDYQPHT